MIMSDCSPESTKLYRNFILFSCLYAISHSTVNVVLAFAAAELGIKTASYGGFSLYAGFTLSAFLIAKPVVKFLGVKKTLAAGMVCFIAFVACFSLSLLSPNLWFVYVLGSCICGTGEGLYWTGQGIYYTMNSKEYSKSSGHEFDEVMTKFASIFAILYLTIEALCKFLSSAVFSIASSDNDVSMSSYKIGLFVVFTIAVVLSTILFSLYATPFQDEEKTSTIDEISNRSGSPGNSSRSFQYRAVADSHTHAITMDDVWQDCSSVASALYSKRLLQYVTPFQLAFGVNAVFMDSYINGVIVKQYVGEEYIGLLSGIMSITSVLIAFPYSYISLNIPNGSYYVMIAASFCFMGTAIPLLMFSDAVIGHLWFVVWLFVFHGCARGAWENTNKAIIGEYFSTRQRSTTTSEAPGDSFHGSSHNSSSSFYHQHGQDERSQPQSELITNKDSNLRDTAFAAVSFCSSLAGALAYICFGSFSRSELAILNIIIGFLAAVGFHKSAVLFQAQQQLLYAFDFKGDQQQEGREAGGDIYNSLHNRFSIADEEDDDDEGGVEFRVRKGFIVDNPEDN